MNRLYQMNQKEYQGLLQVASEQVPFGIYAIEKQGYAELRCNKCSSVTQLKSLTRQFKAQGSRCMQMGGDAVDRVRYRRRLQSHRG